jgi:hypothetical protein
MGALNPEGTSDTQASSHPATQTAVLDWTSLVTDVDGSPFNPAVQEAKTEIFDLPPGFVGNAQVLDRCPVVAVEEATLKPGRCPAASQVGYVNVERGDGLDRSCR